MLETQQKEVHDALVAMEGEALRLYKVNIWPLIIMYAPAILHLAVDILLKRRRIHS